MSQARWNPYSSHVLHGPFAKEARWLCEWSGSNDDAAEIPDLVAEAVLSVARGHRLSAVVGSRLHAVGLTSFDWQRALVHDWRQALGDETLFGDALARLDDAMSLEGIRFVVLKGADLSRRGIYQPGQRAHNDLDLLIEPCNVAVFHRLLLELGYCGDHPALDLANQHWFATTYRHRTQQRLQIDLHWSLGAPGRGDWEVARIVDASEPIGEWRAARRLCRADLWAHLALHAVAYHGAAGRWIWWLDMHRLARQRPISPQEWDSAREHGAYLALQAAQLRAAGLFESSNTVAPAAGWRARLVARTGVEFERGGDSRAKRWSMGVLSADRPINVGLAAWSVAKRLASSVRGSRS